MKSLMFLLHQVVEDLGDRCGVESTDRDFKRAAARVDTEGLSFLTITLPSLAKDLEQVLSLGKTDHTSFAGFQLRGRTPLFLGGFFDLIIDRETGDLLSDPSRDAIRAVRQISLMFAKILLPTSARRERKALTKYLEVDADIPLYDANLKNSPEWEAFLGSVVQSGHVYFLVWMKTSFTKRSFPDMGPVPLLTVLRETESTISRNGPSGWSAYFLLEYTHMPAGLRPIPWSLDSFPTLGVTVLSTWWNIASPVPSDLLGSLRYLKRPKHRG
jgi:hypothetical protein